MKSARAPLKYGEPSKCPGRSGILMKGIQAGSILPKKTIEARLNALRILSLSTKHRTR